MCMYIWHREMMASDDVCKSIDDSAIFLGYLCFFEN